MYNVYALETTSGHYAQIGCFIPANYKRIGHNLTYAEQYPQAEIERIMQ